MEPETTIEIVEPIDTDSIKDVATRAAIGAIVGVVVTQLATYLLHKGAKWYSNKKAAKPETT
jgi:hypothetical protein